MGSIFSLDPLYSYTSSFLKPSDASEMWPRIYFPTGAHLVDLAAEYPDAVVSLEPRQQQQQPTTTTSWQLSPLSEVAVVGVFQ